MSSSSIKDSTTQVNEKVEQALQITPPQPPKTLMDHLTQAIAWFMGSWWGVLAHTLWFTIWLVLDFSIDRLTLIVSLEAIFIGIFLLMYSNKAELKRDIAQSQKQAKALSETIADVALDRKQVVMLEEISHRLKKLEDRLSRIK